MPISPRLRYATALAAALLAPAAALAQQVPAATAKPVIRTQDDLPRHSYPVPTTAAALLAADDATFNAFAAKVAADAGATLAGYDIPDAATKRRLLGTRLSYEMLTGRNEAALATVREIRALEQKPDAKLASGIRDEAILRARIETGAAAGPAFEKRYAELYGQALTALPFAIAGNGMKESKSRAEIQSPSVMAGMVANDIEPSVTREHALNDQGADDLLWVRLFHKVYWPLQKYSVAELRRVIAANTAAKPDIWAAREVTLTAADKAHPVIAAVWDSGVDTALYPGQLHGAHLSFDIDSRPTTGVLRPLTSEQAATWKSLVGDFQGFADNRAAIDSPAAEALRAKLAAMPATETGGYMQQLDFFGDYLHGTHVAGILARGNPMARIAVIRDTYDTRPVPAPPTEESMARRVELFRTVSAWLTANKVRVVNMSWIDTPRSYEDDLRKNGIGKDDAERQALAKRYFAMARDAFAEIIVANPRTLFISAAGNSDSDTGFEEGYPSSLSFPNLLIVNAVDRSGDETGFTSYGKNVVVSANGYQVISKVPGGADLAESGTSMASPNVANLAAKLIALKPDLTPVQVIALIRSGATASADDRLHPIDGKASVALLKAGKY